MTIEKHIQKNRTEFIGYFDADAEIVAAKVAELIKKSVPDYLLGEWRLANNLASMPKAAFHCLLPDHPLKPGDPGLSKH